MAVKWEIRSFAELTTKELYDILYLRTEVFIVEQNCPYQDPDKKDLKSFHLTGTDAQGELMAYSRILPARLSYKEVSIGRVVTSPKVRSAGMGKLLMQQSLLAIRKKFGNVPVRIGAQLYLKKFYESFGFVAVGQEYLEDNIPHVEMLLSRITEI